MRISSLKSQAGMMSLVALEPVKKLAESWKLDDLSDQEYQKTLSQSIQTLFSALAPEVSAISVDRATGLRVASNSPTPLLLPLESQPQAEVDPLALPQIDRHWGVNEIANNYAVAKLQLYYHPEEKLALNKKKLVAELADHCQHEGIDLVLDLVIYTPAGDNFDTNSFQAAQLQAIQELRTLPQALVLQYPQEPLACATITTELDIPWLVSDRGFGYGDFKETLRTSLEGGAEGFMLDTLIWPDLDFTTTQDWKAELAQASKTTARDRLIELARIVDEFSHEE